MWDEFFPFDALHPGRGKLIWPASLARTHAKPLYAYGLICCRRSASCSTLLCQSLTSWSCTKEACQECILEGRRKEGREEVEARKAVLSGELRRLRAVHM